MGSLRLVAPLEFHESKKTGSWGSSTTSESDRSVNLASGRTISRRDSSKCRTLSFGFNLESHLCRYLSEIKLISKSGFVKKVVGCDSKLKHVIISRTGPSVVSCSEANVLRDSESGWATKVHNLDVKLTLENTVLKSPKHRNFNKDVERKREKRIWIRKNSAKKSMPVPSPSKINSSLDYAHLDQKTEVDLPTIGPESSMEECNSLLKLLGKGRVETALEFFRWMKDNGKLKQNVDAYNLMLRVLAWKEDWDRTEMLINEMASHSECELTAQQFKTIIYACAKKGLVEQGAKWFNTMLERDVQPDIATIGMLMGLYQKSGSVSQAEFTFDYMRACKLKCVTAYSAMITICTRLGMYIRAVEIINLMEEDKVPPDLENWLVRLNAYCQQGKMFDAECVLHSMLEVGISPNIVAYNTLITGYGKNSDMKSAELLFQRLCNVGLEPDEVTYRSMVEGFGRSNDFEKTLWYYEQLKCAGFQASSSNFFTLINLYARHMDDKEILCTLKDMRKAGCQYASILGGLLHAYERVGGIHRVPAILSNSFYSSVLLDQTSCCMLVMSYVQNSLLGEALKVLLEKKWNDSNFEDNLYHLLICSCKEAGLHEDAVKIYLQMPKSDSEPNLHITSSMIDVYSAMKRFADAEDLYLKLKASGIPFDVVAYSVTVRMYVKSGSLKDACSILDMMEKQEGVIPDKFLFFDMLRIYQQCEMHEKLADVYYRILKSGIELDESMYNCIINCCGRALPVDELSRLFDEMVTKGYAANTITFNILMDIYGKAGFLQKATKVFWMARRLGLTDIISYNTLISAYAKSKDFSSMKLFVKRMQDAGYEISLEAYNSMLDAYGKEDMLEEFNDILQKMKQASCASDHYTSNIMINIYGKKGWIEEVSDVIAKLKDQGLEPDLYSYNTLIKAYGIAGMVEEAVSLVQEMREKGIEPDRVTYSNLIVALQRNENFLEAVKWSLWMKQIGMTG